MDPPRGLTGSQRLKHGKMTIVKGRLKKKRKKERAGKLEPECSLASAWKLGLFLEKW